MDREDLIDMAVDAGARDFGNPDMWGVLQMSCESIERFAALVAAHERAECAKFCAELRKMAISEEREECAKMKTLMEKTDE